MTDLSGLHQAISAAIETAIPQLATVGSYAAVQQETALPALFHGIVGLKPGVDPGDGHSRVVATFEARISTDGDRPQATLEAITLAAQLMVLLRKQYWNIDFVEEAQGVQALPSSTAATTWTVQWEQVLHLGEVQWPWPNQPPGSLVLAFDPDSGPGHESDYRAPEDFA
ncbi:hypothetical protein V0R50_19700 [Pseudomonas sp. 148P]|uniref:Phage protein n=1 Tax=Pseudomonas ulcerans TaxID=3115852 RepID=A0ABU7HVJ7_9PSED|nr:MULTISPECIES: hypothetical protein [unclassified Pseudomonas]MEE1924292.1 hypothetical protein [Pseudomonas sp. 147P]MEE1935461.1 hypothetical protein [Pseudomonas sp. 148P]